MQVIFILPTIVILHYYIYIYLFVNSFSVYYIHVYEKGKLFVLCQFVFFFYFYNEINLYIILFCSKTISRVDLFKYFTVTVYTGFVSPDKIFL